VSHPSRVAALTGAQSDDDLLGAILRIAEHGDVRVASIIAHLANAEHQHLDDEDLAACLDARLDARTLAHLALCASCRTALSRVGRALFPPANQRANQSVDVGFAASLAQVPPSQINVAASLIAHIHVDTHGALSVHECSGIIRLAPSLTTRRGTADSGITIRASDQSPTLELSLGSVKSGRRISIHVCWGGELPARVCVTQSGRSILDAPMIAHELVVPAIRCHDVRVDVHSPDGRVARAWLIFDQRDPQRGSHDRGAA